MQEIYSKTGLSWGKQPVLLCQKLQTEQILTGWKGELKKTTQNPEQDGKIKPLQVKGTPPQLNKG